MSATPPAGPSRKGKDQKSPVTKQQARKEYLTGIGQSANQYKKKRERAIYRALTYALCLEMDLRSRQLFDDDDLQSAIKEAQNVISDQWKDQLPPPHFKTTALTFATGMTEKRSNRDILNEALSHQSAVFDQVFPVQGAAERRSSHEDNLKYYRTNTPLSIAKYFKRHEEVPLTGTRDQYFQNLVLFLCIARDRKCHPGIDWYRAHEDALDRLIEAQHRWGEHYWREHYQKVSRKQQWPGELCDAIHVESTFRTQARSVAKQICLARIEEDLFQHWKPSLPAIYIDSTAGKIFLKELAGIILPSETAHMR